jgi:hypothetical protein
MILVDWTRWRPATCMPDACFCESIRDGLIRQPANTWSCAAFVLAGAIVLLRSFERPDPRNPNPLRANPTYGALYAAALILIGLGSAFYHASLTFAGQFMDVFGMYLLGTFILLYNLSRLRPIAPSAFSAIYVILNLVLAIGLYAVPGLRRYAFAVLLIAAVWLELRVRRRSRATSDSRFLWIALIAIGAGFVIWILDITRTVCAPTGIVQGHAVWHVAGALAAWCVFRYYRSEAPVAL